MLPDLNRVIEQVSKEKGIGRDIIIKALEEGMLSAAKKTFGHEKNIEAKFHADRGEVELFEIKTVVEHVVDSENQVMLEVARANIDPEAEIGDELLAKLPPEKLGRIAAHAAKQNMIQRVRDAERDVIYDEFKGRKASSSLGSCNASRKNIIVNLGRTDGILPEKEQIPRERYRQGDRIRAFILDVELTGKGTQIVLSRAHPGPPHQTLRAGGARDLRGHRRGEGSGTRAGWAGQDRGHFQRPRRRSGRCLRRHARHACAGRRPGAARRAYRHRIVEK
jgi:N utilization substance protein A